jgi:hypothetical protein
MIIFNIILEHIVQDSKAFVLAINVLMTMQNLYDMYFFGYVD